MRFGWVQIGRWHSIEQSMHDAVACGRTFWGFARIRQTLTKTLEQVL